jgi:hypothetical protein
MRDSKRLTVLREVSEEWVGGQPTHTAALPVPLPVPALSA